MPAVLLLLLLLLGVVVLVACLTLLLWPWLLFFRAPTLLLLLPLFPLPDHHLQQLPRPPHVARLCCHMQHNPGYQQPNELLELHASHGCPATAAADTGCNPRAITLTILGES